MVHSSPERLTDRDRDPPRGTGYQGDQDKETDGNPEGDILSWLPKTAAGAWPT